jgi:hypothetical protein
LSSITTDCMTTWCWAWSEDEASVVDCRPKVGLIEDGMIREVEFKDKANWLIPREEQKSIAHLLRSAFCSIYIHAQIVLPGDRANAVDGATEARRRFWRRSLWTPSRAIVRPVDLSAPNWHCQPIRWECTEVLAIYRSLSDVDY